VSNRAEDGSQKGKSSWRQKGKHKLNDRCVPQSGSTLRYSRYEGEEEGGRGKRLKKKRESNKNRRHK